MMKTSVNGKTVLHRRGTPSRTVRTRAAPPPTQGTWDEDSLSSETEINMLQAMLAKAMQRKELELNAPADADANGANGSNGYTGNGFTIKTFNAISPVGLDRFPKGKYSVAGNDDALPDSPMAIMLRSHKLQNDEVASTVRCIVRCGAGTNNIPVSEMTERGIPVFNTPGANANAVKVYAASEFRENTELRFNYGDKPSQYFLLQYGFLPERNPSDCVEATVRVDERDSLREQKERLLLRHGLDPRTRNFQWKHVGLDYDLIAATRIVMMDESEIDDDTSVALAVSGASVSAKNDARTKAVLLKSLSGFLGGYKTTLGEDNHYVARSSDESSDEPFPGKRKRFAVMLRMTEKRILLSSADAVFKEFPDEDEDLVKSTCEEIFSVEVDECMKRAGGAKFSSFGKRPASKDEESRAEL